MPWKNGKGFTLELAIHPLPESEGLGDFDWRVSIAQVPADGPFSSFPGYDRLILVLEGTGMALTHRPDGREARIGPLESYAFSGEDATSCRLLEGPVRDFNVMTRRGVCSSRLSVLRPGARLEPCGDGAALQLLYCHLGRCQVVVDGGEALRLEAGESLRIDDGPPGGLQVSGAPGTIALLVEIDAAS